MPSLDWRNKTHMSTERTDSTKSQMEAGRILLELKKTFSEPSENYPCSMARVAELTEALLSHLIPSTCPMEEWSRYQRLIAYRQIVLTLLNELKWIGFTLNSSGPLSSKDIASQMTSMHWCDELQLHEYHPLSKLN